jgi:hypothetical protein
MNRHCVFVVFFILNGLHFSCSYSPVRKEVINGKEVIICAVDKVNKKVELLHLSELVDSIEVVKLETNESCLIGHIKKVSLTEHYIGVLDDGISSREYKLFNRHGRFLCKIGSVGQGAFEYTSLSDVQIDESKKSVFLMRFFHVNEILQYDLNGNPNENIPLGYEMLSKSKFVILKDTLLCFQMPLANKSVFAFTQDMEGHVHSSIPATEQMFANNYDGEIYVSNNSEKISVFYTGVDTLFQYDAQRNELNPVFYAEFNEPTIHMYRELPSHYSIWIYIDANNSRNILINKTTLKAFYYELFNDFVDIPVQYYRHDNEQLILLYEAEYLKSQIKNKLSDQQISETLKTQLLSIDEGLTDDDNPVLIIGTLK